jgi:GH25 family lysozyme M1 (1,4-beta-N-acetylmuramidase)
MAARTFKLGSTLIEGADVRSFQADLNFRYGAWDIGKRLELDGEYRAATRDAVREVCRGLGIDHHAALQHAVTPELRIRIRHPERRTTEELERSRGDEARRFRARLRSRFKSVVLTGVDVSNHQPSVDWHAVKDAGHAFAIHKVSEGLGAPDKLFPKRWKAIRDAGLVRGTYHFARPQQGRDGRDEAREVLRLIKDAGGLRDGDLVPALDIEAFGANGRLTASQTLHFARRFVDEIHARLGRKPIIYTGSFWRDEMGNPDDDLGCRLWLAAFVEHPEQFVPKAWKQESYALWQHTETGTCRGIAGRVDLNRLPGGNTALDQLRI